MATYCRHPYIQLPARSSVSLWSGGSILQSKAGPFLASGEASESNCYLWSAIQNAASVRSLESGLLAHIIRES